MYKRLVALLLAGAAAFAPQALACAVTSDIGPDTRIHVLSEQLRRLICQNQAPADSNVDLVVDLHHQIRERPRAGATEADAKDCFMQHYGDSVLYRSSIKRLTYLLWFSLVLLLMAVVLGAVSPRKQQKLAPSELGADAQARLTALLVTLPPEDPRQ